MKVMIADREARVRSALRLLLQEIPHIINIDEAADAESLVYSVNHNPYDLVLLDWKLAGDRTAELLPFLHRLNPGARVVALSVPAEDREAAISAGADAFASKSDPPEQLLQALSMACTTL